MEAENYIKGLRKLIGATSFIHPAARIIIENDKQQILFITRNDNNQFGIPAGSFEWGETIEECIKREVREETGLEILELEVIGISSNPNTESVEYPNGDQVQYFTVEFYCSKWKGQLKSDQVETRNAVFKPLEFKDSLPDNEKNIFESLKFFRRTGKILLR